MGRIDDPEIQDVCDLIVGRALDSYVKSEYGNLWETHQARPHAYGHTWSPGYELPAGMLHGHAVATCMGFGAYMARYHWECQEVVSEELVGSSSDKVCDIGKMPMKPWLSDEQLMRILRLINELE